MYFLDVHYQTILSSQLIIFGIRQHFKHEIPKYFQCLGYEYDVCILKLFWKSLNSVLGFELLFVCNQL